MTMRLFRLIVGSILGIFYLNVSAAELRVVSGLTNPESVLVGKDGRIYVSQIGEFNKDGDGSIVIISTDGKIEPFAKGLDDPKGMTQYGKFIYVTDKQRIWKIGPNGVPSTYVDSRAFPVIPKFLNDLESDDRGNLYVSDSGDIEKGGGGFIFKVAKDRYVNVVVSHKEDKQITNPNGLLLADARHLYVVDFGSGELLRIFLPTKKVEKIASGFGAGDGLVRDKAGVMYLSDWKNGKVFRLNSGNAKPVVYKQSFQAAADISLDAKQRYILVPDMKAGTLTWLPIH